MLAVYKVTGTVRDATSSKPIPKALLKLGAKETRSASDGTYTFDEVAPGEYILEARAEGYKSLELKVKVADADIKKDLMLKPDEQTGCGCTATNHAGTPNILILAILAVILQCRSRNHRKS